MVACTRILQSFLSKNTRSVLPSLAAARVTRSGPPSLWRHGPSHKARARHGGTHVTRVTRHAQRPARLRLTRPGPSHSQRSAVHSPPRSPQPESLAAASRPQPARASLAAARDNRSCPPSPAAGRHGSHSQRPAVTRRSSPQSPRPSHLLRPVSLQWRRGPPSLAAARLTDSVTRRRLGAKAEIYVVVRI